MIRADPVPASVEEQPKEAEPEKKRGFWSRLFGRGKDKKDDKKKPPPPQ